ncbi:SH3 domain-containing protein [Mucilaginibacter sp. UYCu711]|uniref:SH3 domain-containing protein n=1 Tax=Mucilaginibacter sp. UYCu711 TaxID=3156339 RepID=UPI003D1FE22E
MALTDKYAELIQAAKTGGISNVQVREQDNILYIDGSTNSGALKDSLWDVYNKIDPDYRAGDLVLNIDASAASGTKATVSTESSNLNIRKGPGTDQPVVGKTAHNEVVLIVSRPNEQWSLVRTDGGIEGYAYSQYLTQS